MVLQFGLSEYSIVDSEPAATVAAVVISIADIALK